MRLAWPTEVLPHRGERTCDSPNPHRVDVRHAITGALADVGPVVFVSSPDAVIVDRHGCARVRDQGILITLGPLVGMGDRVEVGRNGFVACLGAAWVTYRVGWTGKGWIVHETFAGRSPEGHPIQPLSRT